MSASRCKAKHRQAASGSPPPVQLPPVLKAKTHQPVLHLGNFPLLVSRAEAIDACGRMLGTIGACQICNFLLLVSGVEAVDACGSMLGNIGACEEEDFEVLCEVQELSEAALQVDCCCCCICARNCLFCLLMLLCTLFSKEVMSACIARTMRLTEMMSLRRASPLSFAMPWMSSSKSRKPLPSTSRVSKRSICSSSAMSRLLRISRNGLCPIRSEKNSGVMLTCLSSSMGTWCNGTLKLSG
mmetsp:Transcript_36654/g.118423  ORF Transcript_36654/g.118423 Transcript_36654/m.118423 type:complete len:241 (+) Transcript_36654:588-1310(+)